MARKIEVHESPREDIKRTRSPTDMLMSTSCMDAYDSLTGIQKVAIRIKHLFRPRDSYIDRV